MTGVLFEAWRAQPPFESSYCKFDFLCGVITVGVRYKVKFYFDLWRQCSSLAMASLKVAVIGQSVFGLEVYKLLRKKGHTVVGVFTIPDVNGKSDPLGAEAEKDGVPVFKFKAWRAKATGQVLPGVFEKYKSVDAELNVLPFCSQFIPMDVINHPKHKSIIYHPSILPRHRGASAINW